MPVIKSAIKKARQDERARKRNRVIRDNYKAAAKKVRKLAESKDAKKAAEALKEAYSKIDVAAKKGIIHKNNASRRKKRLAATVKGTLSKESKPKTESKAKSTKEKK